MDSIRTREDAVPAREPSAEDWDTLRKMAQRVFDTNPVELPGLLYHMPSPRIYTSLFAWDSGFHAIALTHLDPELAAAELQTLFSRVMADGRLPHENLLPGAPREGWFRRWLASYSRRNYENNGPTHLVDPPIYLVAAEMVWRETGDLAWLQHVWPQMKQCLDYLLYRRDDFGDGLVTIRHPWEAGTDLSPQFFEALGIDTSKPSHWLKAELAGPMLYRACARRHWHPVRRRDCFVLEDLTMNCITIRACRAVAQMAAALDQTAEAAKFEERAHLMMDALDRICWNDEAQIYFPRFDLSQPRLSRVKTAASLLPLFTGLCRRDRAAALVCNHLSTGSDFWGP